MKIYYASMTGNVRRFVTKLGVEAADIDLNPIASEPYILVCYTFGFGEVPKKVDKWLQNNVQYLQGVIVSGNRNWGDNFGKAGEIISRKYDVKLLRKIELSGNIEDVKEVQNLIGGDTNGIEMENM